MSDRNLIIATRGSRLALAQTEHVAACLRAAHPGLTVEHRVYSTRGDERTDVPLPAVGGKGLFTAELERALLSGEAHLAVHSLKDLPTSLPDGLCLAAVPPREDPHDALVLPSGTDAGTAEPLHLLPAGAKVGTSSLRRAAFLRHRRPDLQVESVRGNVETRLRKLDEGHYDAIILACAGLRRLGLADRISRPLPIELSLPAPGQGALGIEASATDQAVLDLLAALHDVVTWQRIVAERTVLATLGGGCQAPCGAHAMVDGEAMRLLGAVAAPDGSAMVWREAVGPAAKAALLGANLARDLLADGADRLLGR